MNYCMGCMRPIQAGETVCPKCGWNHGQGGQKEFALPLGSSLHNGKYLVGRMLGQGGFGITYIGLDVALNMKVAIKEYYPQTMASRAMGSSSLLWHSEAMEKDAGRENFVKEARNMAKITDIPNVAQVRDIFYQNDTAYIVMNYVEGETLKDRLMRNGPMDEDTCFEILRPVMESLGEAHKLGMIHRDISPDNIMIDKRGRVWLMDMGAAKELDINRDSANNAQSTRLVIRHGFSPLEQFSSGGKIGSWTDVYAMSATIYYCLTGKVLPDALDRLYNDHISYPDGISPQVRQMLAKGLILNPEERMQTMGDMLGIWKGDTQTEDKSAGRLLNSTDEAGGRERRKGQYDGDGAQTQPVQNSGQGLQSMENIIQQGHGKEIPRDGSLPHKGEDDREKDSHEAIGQARADTVRHDSPEQPDASSFSSSENGTKTGVLHAIGKHKAACLATVVGIAAVVAVVLNGVVGSKGSSTDANNGEESVIYTADAAEYGFVGKAVYDEARCVQRSDYAKAMGSYGDYLGYGRWWLRSPGYYANYATFVRDDGNVDDYGGLVDYGNLGVRAALNLNLLSSHLYSQAGTVSSDGKVNENATDVEMLHNPAIQENVSGRESGQIVTWDCVYFGNYPQKEITSGDDAYAKLCSMEDSAYSANGDIEIDGVKYRRISKEEATYVSKSEGQYHWDDEYHYFQYEPIKWRILSTNGETALLLSELILDDQPYHVESMDVTWETSTIRSWLNGYGADQNACAIDYGSKNFIDTAFTTEEQKAIRTTAVENKDNLQYGTSGGNDTEDRIFLLSESEVYTQ